ANQFERDRDLTGRHDDTVSAAALAEAQGITRRLAAGGARLVLEAPKPVFPSPIFRCTDWFNRTNPACHGLTVEREAMLQRRRHVMQAMRVLA
ncbi:hypothetical protein INQ29_23860, partial [Escherichia coli]|nr:hypothetical protein [Escherichia coli]